MRGHTAACVLLSALILLACRHALLLLSAGSPDGTSSRHSEGQRVSQGPDFTHPPAAAAAAAAATQSSLGGLVSTARHVLSARQQPNRAAGPVPRQQPPAAAGSTGNINSDSSSVPPNLNPTVISISRPPRPAPAPAATSAAAGEAAPPQPYTGPSVKRVTDVKAGDSCVCWSPDLCTCGWQACPYKPPDAAAALPSDAAQALFGPDVLPQIRQSADAPQAKPAPLLPDSMLRQFNKRISTQLINPLYQFTTDHYVLEGAKEVVAAGGDSYKFHLANLDARGQPISNVRTPLDMVRSPSLPYAAVFDQPLSAFFMWVFPNFSRPYEETHELAAYLLQKYQGTGKQFFIGMWEGDHALRIPGRWGLHIPPDVARMETMLRVMQQKQRAVDDAKREQPSCRNVYVWNYIEANFVLPSIWDQAKISIVNWLVPNIRDPPIDYISYSAYEVLFSGDWQLDNLTAAFDYMALRLPPKAGVPGPRVFLGEWAFPMLDPKGNPAWTLEESREKGLYAAAVAIAWGSQFNQYWQLYSNHRLNNGTGDRGFWLILPNRQESPIWTSMKDYFAASDLFLQRFWACYGGWPSDYTYRVWAVKTLMKLVNNATKPEPTVRQLGPPGGDTKARVVTERSNAAQLGPTITFRVQGQAPADAAARSSNYIPIMGAVQLADGSSSSSSSDGSQAFTPPLVPQFLPAGGGNRGSCPVALPMLQAGTPVPPKPSPAPATNTTNSASNSSASAGEALSERQSGRLQPTLLSAHSSNKAMAADGHQAVELPGGRKSNTCEGWTQVLRKLKLSSKDCPFQYPRLSLEDMASGTVKPYAYGGIDRPGCVNCRKHGLWPDLCLGRRPGLPGWDMAQSCNEQGESAAKKSLQAALNMTQNWPGSSGIAVSSSLDAQRLTTPGPAELTPCDVYKLLRGRTLWLIGDTQMKGLFSALKCFMLEFWDLKQYKPSWNSSTNALLGRLPRSAEGRCIHLPESTRICHLKVLWADTFSEQPSASGARRTVPVWTLLQQQLAAPEDVFVLNFGAMYDPQNPTRYHDNLLSVGRTYEAAKGTFPNWLFVESLLVGWPGAAAQRSTARGVQMAQSKQPCGPLDGLLPGSQVGPPSKAARIDAAAIARAAEQLMSLGLPINQPGAAAGSSSSGSGGGSSGSGRHLRKLLRLLQQQQQQQQPAPGSSRGWVSLGRLARDRAFFPLLLPTIAVDSPSRQRQQQQPPVDLSGSSDGSSDGAAAASSSSAQQGEQGEQATQFPRLQPTFAVSRPLQQSRPRSEGAAAAAVPAGLDKATPPLGAGQAKAAAAATAHELAADAVLSGAWRNQVAQAVLRDKFNMPWVPTQSLQGQQVESTGGCVSLCSLGAPQSWMAQLMLAISVNTQPLSGETLDRRCLWGNEVVREKGGDSGLQ